MHPIINPWFFYFISIADGIKTLFIACSVILGVIGGLLILGFILDEEDVPKIITSKIKPTIISCILFTILSILTPSKTTLYQILIAKNFTYENVELTKKEGKEFINYIIKTTKEEVKDENE